MSPAFKMVLLRLAAYYDKVLTDQQLQVYAEQLSRHLSEAEANDAALKYIDDPANEFFPRPVSKLVALIKKPVDTKDQAQNVINLIKKAVVNHQSNWVTGYFDHYADNRQPVFVFYNSKQEIFNNWRDAARSEIGELGLTIVDQLGGWQRVCERFDQEPEGVVVGQYVKNAESIINIAEVGKLNEAPALPDASKNILDLIKYKQLNPPQE